MSCHCARNNYDLAGYALWDLSEAIENGFDTSLKDALVSNFRK